MIRLSELRYKEVINECTCRRLGCIEDLEFDEKCGQICAVIIPGQCKCFGLFGICDSFPLHPPDWSRHCLGGSGRESSYQVIISLTKLKNTIK